ncbi:uncharacterized protein LOC126836639 isoform X2 [Adelges cooleyi]|uniref:uncharacterized protein LOC126836639 isoform X2 n=1 Tax=Adelges cooleyi TaxID=133065 RepID=UPI00217FADFE|nr:uncharacterized protein LOC126836639 isoform X2 [Adelges cooleyi]
MVSCFICGRSRNEKSKEAKITFHRFPINDTLRQKWYEFVLNNSLNPGKIKKYSSVCSTHFHQKDIINYKRTTYLTETAVPMIYISRVKNAKLSYPEYWSKNSQPSLTTHISDDHGASIIKSEPDDEDNAQPIKSEPVFHSPAFDADTGTVIKSEYIDENTDEYQESITDSYPLLTGDAPSLPLHNTENIINDHSAETKIKNKGKAFILVSTKPSVKDSPDCLFLKRYIASLNTDLRAKTTKLKNAQQTIRRQHTRITSLKSTIAELKHILKNKTE